MADYVEKLWLLPAVAIAADAVLLLAMWRLPQSAVRVGYNIAQDAYEVMFLATPLVGVAVLVWFLWLKWSRPGAALHPRARRALWLSLLALAAPVWMLLLGIVLSGFAR